MAGKEGIFMRKPQGSIKTLFVVSIILLTGILLSIQTFINIGMCIGITPVIGITLPFFSYGGSSMVTMFAAMGLVSGVKFKLKPQLFSIY